MRIMNRSWLSLLLAVSLSMLAFHANAQPRPQQQVIDLNRQAMEAYNNLEIDQARQLLEQAEQLATQNHVTGAPLARTYLNLGVLQIAGLGDNAAGLQLFIQALRADSTVQLDPLTSTPEIQLMYARARNEVGTAVTTQPDPVVSTDPPPSNIPHEAVPEQLVQTPVPVFLEVPPRQRVSEVNLYYRGHGMRAYRQVAMDRMRGGYGFEIPCHDVFEPAIYYYIEVIGRNGDRVAFVGNEERPVTVPIVTTRNHPPPSLPGQAPPQQCASQEECPPGMPGCGGGGTAGLGDACSRDRDCQDALSCEEGLCISDEASEAPPVEEEPAPRLFAHLGLAMGGGYASPGMLADAPPPSGSNSPAWVPGAAGTECTAIDQYCVRVATPGLSPSLGLSVVAGYYVLPRVAVAATFRLAFASGVGPLHNMIFGGRAQYALVLPHATGLQLDAFVGGGLGEFQVQPSGNGNPSPWIISGQGNANFGAVLVYRFVRNFGVQASVEAKFMLPTFMFVVDTNLGVVVAF